MGLYELPKCNYHLFFTSTLRSFVSAGRQGKAGTRTVNFESNLQLDSTMEEIAWTLIL